MKPTWLTLLKNLALLALIASPIFFLLAWIRDLIHGVDWSQDLGYALGTVGFFYLVSIVWVLLGGLVHQLLLIVLPSTWPPRQRRIVAVASTPIIPLVLILFGGPVWTVSSYWLPAVISLVVYAMLIRLPESSARPPA